MKSRDPSLDAARGLAVVMMVFIHFVPTTGGDAWWSRLGTSLTALVYDHCASLFCVLAGMARVLAAAPPAVVVRRSVVLLAMGVVLGRTLWPTEILSPLGMMLLLADPLRRLGVRAQVAALATVLAMVPLAMLWWGHWSEVDWLEDGRHVAETGISWATLRFYLLNGNYPLLPWLAYVLIGGLWATVPAHRARSAIVFFICAAIAIAGPFYRQWIDDHAEALGAPAQHLAITWVPTSVPYVAWTAATAIAIISALGWLHRFTTASTWLRPMATFGRLSLFHYVLHIAVVFAPLRLCYPAEDWSAELGLAVALTYLGIAVPASMLWSQRRP